MTIDKWFYKKMNLFCIVFIIKSNSIRELTYIWIVYILASAHPFHLKYRLVHKEIVILRQCTVVN